MLKLLKDLVERRVFRYVVAYAAIGWALLEVVDQFVGNGVLPAWHYRAALTLVACGFPGALIVSWFHGARGRQEVPVIERWLLSGVALFALATTVFVARSGLAAESASGPRVLSDWEDPSRVAVMYFEPRPSGGDAEFLAAGLTEALIDELTGISGIEVISRNGSGLFRNVRDVRSDSIGRTLGAGTIVTGTVAQAGEVIRVGVRMESAATGEQFASDEITASRSDIFALQDSLAETVALWLRTEIGTELGQVRLRGSTSVAAAWERVQQGQQTASGVAVLLAGNDLVGAARQLAKADSLLGEAEALDPTWAEPASRRGWLAYRQSRLGGMDRDHYVEWIGRGVEHANRALAIDSAYVDALELRGTLLYWNSLLNLGGSPEESDRLKQLAEQDLYDAIAQEPTRASALNTLSHLLLNKGEVAPAKLAALDAYRADPFLESANLTLWRIFTASFSLQDGFEARNYCTEGVRRFPDDFRFAQCQLMLMGIPGEEVDIPRAWRLVDEFAEKSPPQNREVNRYRGYMYVGTALARKAATSEASVRDWLADSARSVLVRGRASTEVDPLRETALLESIGRTALGDGEEAVRQLSVYLAANPGELEGYRAGAAAGDVPWYHKALIEEPRFRALTGQR